MEGAKIWEEQVIIPTYEIGEADKNPIFLDKRCVYLYDPDSDL